MAGDPHTVRGILDSLAEAANAKGEVSLGDMVEAFGHRSYGPFLIVIPLIDISPVGGVPGLPTVLAVIVILFAGQMLLGRKDLSLPQFLARRSIASEKVDKAARKMRPLAGRLDRWFHGRLPQLTSGLFIRVAALACILLALTVPPLELVPFATTAPMAAIAMFGLALLVHDGVLMIAATIAALVAVGVTFGILL